MATQLSVGQYLNWHGCRFQVSDLNNDHVTLMGARYGNSRHAVLSDIEVALSNQEIVIEAPPIDQLALLPLVKASAGARSTIDRRRHYVNQVLAMGKIGHRGYIQMAIGQVASRIGDDNPPCVTQVYEWSRRFREQEQDIHALATRYAASGNHKSRFDEQLVGLFDQTMDDFYLQLNRPSAQQAFEWLGDLLVEFNKGKTAQRLKMPSRATFYTWIRVLVDPYWRVARREGPHVAIRKFRGRGEGVISTYPLERVEIDHTILDVQIIDPITQQIIGRPTFTWAMDHYSRVILGIQVSLMPPSSTLVLACMKQVMQDKTLQLHELSNMAGFRWDMHGVPTVIVVDNGADFHSENFKEACSRHGISLQYCPPGQPWFKGRVERFVGTLNVGLVHLLPGTTRSNTVARGDYPSEKLATLTLEEVRQYIQRWIVCEYHQRRHRTLGDSPQAVWRAGLSTHPARTVANPATLDLELAMTFTATINGGRLQFKNLRYGSPLLVALEMKLGKKNRKVSGLLDPDDISQVYVRDPLGGALLTVPCTTQGVQEKMSLDSYQSLQKVRASPSDIPCGSLNDAAKAVKREIHARHEEAVKHKGYPSKKPPSTHPLNKKQMARIEEGLKKIPEDAIPVLNPKPAVKTKDPFVDDVNECDVMLRKLRSK